MTDVTLTHAQQQALAILADLEPRTAFVPPPGQRAAFQKLVALGLALSRGQGLGGEGFAATLAGRRAAYGGPTSADHPKRARGLALVPPERRREIASKGVRSVEPAQRAFSKDRTLAGHAAKAGGAASTEARRKKRRERDPTGE
jgi:general stress protein YciG